MNNFKPKTKVQKVVDKITTSIVEKLRTNVKGGKQSKAKNAITKSKSAPVNTDFKYVNRAPRSIASNEGIRISHTEYVQDVTSGTSAGSLGIKFNINPSNVDLFPWLSSTAINYAQFKINSLQFHYKSIVGTTMSGMVGLVATPDCVDPVPGTKESFMNYEGATRGNVWNSFTFNVPKDILNRLPYYLTSSTVTSVTDTTREVGQLFLLIDGCAGYPGTVTYDNNIGEIYVTYDITLKHTQPNSAGTYNINEVYTSSTGGLITNNTYSNSQVLTEGGSSFSPGDYTYLTFKQGAQYRVLVQFTGSAGTWNTYGLPTITCQDQYNTNLALSPIFLGYGSVPIASATIANFMVFAEIPSNGSLRFISPTPGSDPITTTIEGARGTNTNFLPTLIKQIAEQSPAFSDEENSDGTIISHDLSSSFIHRVGQAMKIHKNK
jgi:hypothetical protein